MAKRMKFPHRIETDQGNTIVKLVPSSKATKFHRCPECDRDTEMFEKHVLLLPTRFPDNRRYLHMSCYEQALRDKRKIILHPNLDYLTPLLRDSD